MLARLLNGHVAIEIIIREKGKIELGETNR